MSGCASTDDVVSNFFKVKKGFITSHAPYILVSLLQQLSDRDRNLGKVRNKPSIVARKPKETSHLVHRHWRLPIQDISHLGRVHRYSIR
jgi:hypothetical protein